MRNADFEKRTLILTFSHGEKELPLPAGEGWGEGAFDPMRLAPISIRGGHLTQKFKFIEAFAGSFRDRAERIFGNVDR